MKKLSIFIAVCISLVAPFALKAAACSCVPPASTLTVKQQVVKAMKNSGAVFSAKIVAVKDDARGGQQITYTIEVNRVWKGKVSKTTTISTGSNSAMCGFNFAEGGTYLIYAGGTSKDGFHTTHCTRTARLEESEDVKYLGKGRKAPRNV